MAGPEMAWQAMEIEELGSATPAAFLRDAFASVP